MSRKPKKRRPTEFRRTDRFEKAKAVAGDPHDRLAEASPLRRCLFAAALVAAVFAAYLPAWRGDFIWDDDTHLLNNPVLKTRGVAPIWVPGNCFAYWPLTFTVYRLEFEAWGRSPLGYHLVNIGLHAAIALLIWRVLTELALPGAMLAAAIFALHPVNVESVAWITQLKGILSLLFCLVSALFYLQHDRRGGWRRYAAAIAAFGLSMLAKGMTITLPVVLLACAWWRRGAIQRRDIVRLLSFVLVAGVMTGVEIWMQQRVQGDGGPVRSDSLLSRTAVAGRAVWFYLGKLLWPVDLNFVYPMWKVDDYDLLSFLPGLLLAALFVLAWQRRGSWGRPAAMLMICYVASLAPALGFVNIYYMRYSLVADHYQYAAAIVPCAAAGVVGALIFRKLRRGAVGALALLLLAALAGLTWRQSHMYSDIATLYQTTIERNPNCWMAHGNLGLEFAKSGQNGAAISEYRKALQIKPDYVEARLNLANSLARGGQVDEAISEYQRVLEIKPDYVAAHLDFGWILANKGRVGEAIAHYQTVLQLKPGHAEACNNLGLALAGSGHLQEAVAYYRKAIENKPDYFEARYNLGAALAGAGLFNEAKIHYRKALEFKPGFAEGRYMLGLASARSGDADQAIIEYRRALEIKPDYADAHNSLANVLADRGEIDEAIVHFRKVVEVEPDSLRSHYNLGAALVQRKHIEEAIVHFRKALDLAVAENDKNLADRIRSQINALQN